MEVSKMRKIHCKIDPHRKNNDRAISGVDVGSRNILLVCELDIGLFFGNILNFDDASSPVMLNIISVWRGLVRHHLRVLQVQFCRETDSSSPNCHSVSTD